MTVKSSLWLVLAVATGKNMDYHVVKGLKIRQSTIE